MRVQQLVGASPDPFEALLPQPDDFGRRLEELVGVVCAFRLAFARLGPLAQRLFDFSRRVDGLADEFEEVALRSDDVDTWELVSLRCIARASVRTPPHQQQQRRGRRKNVGIAAALTFAHAIEIPVQTQDLPHLRQPLLQPHRHHIPVQLRPREPLPLLLLLVLILQSRRLPRTGPRRLRRPRAVQRAVKVGRRGGGGVRKRRRRHLVHFGRPAAAAAGDFFESGHEGGGIEGATCRHGGLT